MFSSERDEKGMTPSDLITSSHSAYVISENTGDISWGIKRFSLPNATLEVEKNIRDKHRVQLVITEQDLEWPRPENRGFEPINKEWFCAALDASNPPRWLFQSSQSIEAPQLNYAKEKTELFNAQDSGWLCTSQNTLSWTGPSKIPKSNS